MKTLRFCVYVLYSFSDHGFYIGHTSNLSRRLSQHFSGRSVSTRDRGPFRLVLCEYFMSRDDAMRSEAELNTQGGVRFLRRTLARTIEFITTPYKTDQPR